MNADVKTLTIAGMEVGASADQSILDVARENGIFIPTLCHLDGLSELGAAGCAWWKSKDQPVWLPACVTKVEEGMEVTVESERLSKYRRTILELLFSERNHVCSVCVSNGHCDLQTMSRCSR